jgi:hypothetical protein
MKVSKPKRNKINTEYVLLGYLRGNISGVFSIFRARAELANTHGLAGRYLQIIF